MVSTAQTINITSGVQIYTSLSSTTVNMSSRCELRITATSSALSGCTINLNSSYAWLFFLNIRPSVVSSTYLSQIHVNGAAATAGSNCRLEEYGMGTVIIPQSSIFTPLQVFSAPNFAGTSAQFSLYTYYNTSLAQGAMWQNIGSFKLKRGYMATFAQNANGTGASQVFVAQDGDLELSMMPTNLDHNCSFVRVFPWRATSKKGWGGGQYNTTTDPLWWYDWGNGSASTAGLEYLPMKWSSSSGTGNIDNKQNVTHVLGYNEPDSTSQANMTTNAAIADWPTMMKWGLRVGAPASSDSGVSGQGMDWTMNFMALATNLGYRVDFIPVHWYKCGQTPSQLSNYLYTVYQAYHRPMWVTEWNDGASWCTPLPATTNAEAAALTNFCTMLENCPFVERYSIYSYWSGTAGTNLQLVTGSGSGTLTAAGVAYKNIQSKIAYIQPPPAGGSRGIAQFHFETNTIDTSGYGNNGFVVGAPGFTNGYSGQAVVLDGTATYIQLPPNMANSSSFSFAGWVYWNGGGNGQRIFDFGNDTNHYLYLSPSGSSGKLRFAICNGVKTNLVETTALPVGQWTHVAITVNSAFARLYVNGAQAAALISPGAPSAISPTNNYLGKSQNPADPMFNGCLDEVQIADSAFTATQISSLVTDTPPQFVTNLISGVTATQTIAYSSSLAGMATDADPGDTLAYSKAGGPAWLSVAADGTLGGTPAPSDVGTNYFTLRVTDAAGASAFAVDVINTIVSTNANGVWNADASGVWSDTSKWSGGAVATGAGLSADFSTINITADRTVTLDSSRSIGTLKFGETSGAQSWILASSGGSVLTLDTGAGTPASVMVNQNTATISAPLNAVAGFTKSGAGTLTLSGLDTNSGPTTVSGGTLALAGGTSIAGTRFITVGAGATLDVTASGLTLGAAQTLTGSGTVLGNLTVDGTFAPGGGIGILTCGNDVTLQADGTNVFEISHSPLANDFANISGALTEGGTLIVTNISGTLAAGDSFQLFNAGSYNGAFANVILPALNSGLAWDTNSLNTNGVIAVVSTAPPNPPVIGAISFSDGGGLALSGTGGVAGATFYLLASTNLDTPVSNWDRLLTNQFDVNGNFNFTNPFGTNTQSFYQLQMP